MRGLFTKDLLIIRNQWKTLIMIVACGIIMSLSFEVTTVVAYLGILSAILSLGTMSYDEFENGYTFLMTLPVSRKTYVREKFIFSLLFTLAGIIFASLIGVILVMVTGKGSISDIAPTALIMLCMACVLFSIMIPLRIKYGSEKSKIVLYIVFAVMAGVIFLFTKAAGGLSESLMNSLDKISPVTAGIILAVITAVIVMISEQVSERVMMKKEF